MTSRRSKESKKAIPEPKKGQNEGPDVKESKDGGLEELDESEGSCHLSILRRHT